jgi:succinate-acetate transporter protein
VGFSLAHGSGAVLLLAPFFLALWAVVTLVLIVVALVKKKRIDTPTWLAFGLAVLLFGLLSAAQRRLAEAVHPPNGLLSACR